MDAETPAGLGPAGAALWADIAGSYELRADELQVLEDAARETDLIARLESALVDAPLTVEGSTGQMVMHPLVSEIRQHRVTKAALLRQLKLPDESDVEGRSTSARAAANARWSRRGA